MGLRHLMKRRLPISIHIAPRLAENFLVSIISVGFVVVRVQETLDGVISQS